MTIAQRKLLIAVLALFCSTAVMAADAPKAEPAKDAKADEKKDGKEVKEAKADAPAEPDLPSKPYPSNATPKAFQPKKDAPKADAGGDKPADKAAEKPAEKPAAKPGADKAAEKPADKHAADKHGADKHGADKHGADKHGADKHGADKHGAEKPADAHSTAQHKAEPAPYKAVKKHRTGHNAQAKSQTPAATPAMQELAREMAVRQPNVGGQSYVVQARDNLDSVIRKTLPAKLFSADVLRQAYLRANPALMTAANVKLRPGQVLQVPDASTLRDVIMAEGGKGNGRDTRVSLYSTAPVIAPTMAPAAYDQTPPIAIPRLPVNVAGSANPAPEVSPEEKKKWVRYP